MKDQKKKELLIAVQNAKKEGVSDREILEIVLQGTDTTQQAAESEITESEPEETVETTLAQQVTFIMHEVGIPAHIKGYYYIRSAIVYAMDNPIALQMITKRLYPAVAKMHQTTPSRTERAIRNAIEVAWSRGKLKKAEEIFGYTVDSSKGKPTNSEFIAGIVDYLNMNK